MEFQDYFATHGRGVFEFVQNEFASLDSIEIKTYVEGKVHFQSNLSIEKLLQLKTVERVFLSLLFEKIETIVIEKDVIFKTLKTSLNKINFERIKIFLKNKTYEQTDSENETPSKRISCAKKFRINCKLTGKWKKIKNYREEIVEFILNEVKLNEPRFEIDSDEPDFELICHLSETCLVIGVPISKEPLSKRSYIKHVGLRSTICAIMLQLSKTNHDTAFVLDPFCGKSSIFTEFFGQAQQKNNFLISSDPDLEQLNFSLENLNQNQGSIDFVQTGIRHGLNLPYRDNLFDLIITDLPFGKNHSVKFFNEELTKKTFYRCILLEFERLINKTDGLIVILINSNDQSTLEKEIFTLNDERQLNLEIKSKHHISLGETSSHVFKIMRILDQF